MSKLMTKKYGEKLELGGDLKMTLGLAERLETAAKRRPGGAPPVSAAVHEVGDRVADRSGDQYGLPKAGPQSCAPRLPSSWIVERLTTQRDRLGHSDAVGPRLARIQSRFETRWRAVAHPSAQGRSPIIGANSGALSQWLRQEPRSNPFGARNHCPRLHRSC
jgi:hypothetical protein